MGLEEPVPQPTAHVEGLSGALPAPAQAARQDGENSSASSQDEVSILPKHTRVLVTGNNRTKRALIGQEAIVKKAVGLGGWHWLVRDGAIA